MADDPRLDEILGDWLERRERGAAELPDDVVAQHPDLAEALRARFAALDFVDLALSAEARAAAPPERVGRYTVVRELGAGGMGTVYLATDGNGTAVALKVLHPHLLGREGSFKRFLREADLGRSVEHANVVRTLDADAALTGGRALHYLVMEYVEGQTLRELLADLGRVPEELCRHVGREVAQGLAAIHAAGVVHRDLKPENVLITKEHVVKVMDLGVARPTAGSARLSRTGAFVGSLGYAAPEQFGVLRAAGTQDAVPRSASGAMGDEPSHSIDGRADLYALGVVLYELATGTQPFEGGDPGAVLRRVIDEAPRRCAEINPQLSPFFEEVVHTLLAKNRDERFPSAADVAAVLAEGERSVWWTSRAKEIRAATKRPLRRIRIPRETALYGREEELALLHGLFATAKAGDGRVLLVEGEAGIGKSRLVDEFVGLLRAGGEDLNFLFGGYPPGGAATASGAFSTAYREQFGDAGSAPYLAETPLLVPAFDALLRGDGAPSGAEPLTKDSLQTVFVHATRALAAERPTIVLIEDLHFAPEEGRALFASLALAVPGHRILLVGTARPGVPETWTTQIDRLEHARRLPLPRLGPKDLVRLLRDALRSEHLAEELAGRIGVKSDGNPFFVFEILRGLKEGQFLAQRPDGTWHTTEILRDIHVPSSITDLVQARIADLDDDDRNLLEVASCQGFEFDLGLAAEVLGLARIPALQRLGRIEKRHRLVRSAGDRFVFDHHQVQESLYGGLSKPLREEYHAAIGGALERRHDAASKDPGELEGGDCVVLCEHLLEGRQGARALRFLDAALSHLERGYQHDQTTRLAERALAVPGPLEGKERAKVLLRLAWALYPMGRRARWEECAHEAGRVAEAAGDDEMRGEAARALGILCWNTGRYEEAKTAQLRALESARSRGDKKAEGRAAGDLGNVMGVQGRLAEAREHYERSLALSREIRDRQGEACATGNLGVVFCLQGRYAESQELNERSLALSRAIEDRRGEAVAMGRLGILLCHEGRYAEAREHHERWLAISRQIGDRWGESDAAVYLGDVFRCEGRFAEAREYFERSLALHREIGNRKGEGVDFMMLSTVLLTEGRYSEAREHCERSLALSREIGHRDGEACATAHLASVFCCQGRYAEAREHYERSLALGRERGDRTHEAVVLVNLGPTWRALGERRRARQALDQSLALCREIGERYAEGYGLLGLAALADEEGDTADALRLAEESLALRREIGHRDGVADSLVEIGDLRRRAGDAEAARAPLDEALSLSRELGLRRIVARALALLACLPGGDAGAAEAALAEAGERREVAPMAEMAKMHFLLWQATRDPAHLTEAKRRLDFLVQHAPPECRESMIANVRLHREIVEAWSAHGSP